LCKNCSFLKYLILQRSAKSLSIYNNEGNGKKLDNDHTLLFKKINLNYLNEIQFELFDISKKFQKLQRTINVYKMLKSCDTYSKSS
jgi:hypothetical protein